MTLAGIEPATFRFVAQHLNHCATAVPSPHKYVPYLLFSVILTLQSDSLQRIYLCSGITVGVLWGRKMEHSDKLHIIFTLKNFKRH